MFDHLDCFEHTSISYKYSVDEFGFYPKMTPCSKKNTHILIKKGPMIKSLLNFSFGFHEYGMANVSNFK